MKQLILIVTALCITYGANAQKNFEGVVQYDFNVLELNFTWFTMEVYYKNKKILVKSFIKDPTTNKNVLQSEQLMDYEKGIAYTIEKSQKSIVADSMLHNIVYTKIKSQGKSTEKILNYTCTKNVYDTITSPTGEIDNTGIFYYADDLVFDVPAIYANTDPAPFLGGTNRVCLSATTTTTIYRHATSKINVIATSVISKNLPDSLFNLPPFKTTIKQKNGVYDIKMTELKKIPASNVVPPPPPPMPSKPSQKAKSKNVKKTTTKPL